MAEIARRTFLQIGLGAAAVAKVAPGVALVRGPVNGVLIARKSGTLAIYGDPRPHPAPAKAVLFTHHRRDVAWAGRELVRRGARAIAPEAEIPLFSGAAAFWEQFRTKRFHDYACQSTRILAEPLPVAQGVKDGDAIDGIQVIETPGYTRGAISYLIESGGRRIASTGDLIYGDGRILDLFSLQDAIPSVKEDGYHGYAARAGNVIASLRKIAAWKPDMLIPARGPAIRDPRQAIERLTARLRAVFANHFAIDALRWYRGDDRARAMAARILGPQPVEWMPMAERVEKTLPEWVVPITNSRLLVSRTGAGFLVDCGNRRVIEEIRRLLASGRVKRLDGIYITHYHDDHTDMAQAGADEFNCPVYFCREQRDILEHPEAYRMPCLTRNAIRGGRPMEEGAQQRWNEFEFTYSYFPGQTLFHGGLLVRHENGRSIFFAGDSFTPTGMDDYCLLNRNLLAPEQGYADCLRRIRALAGDYLLINQHVPPAFRYSPRQLDLMTASFAKRRALMVDLFPWPDPNFGLDEQWARFYPYGAQAVVGKPLGLEVIVRNHAAEAREFRVTPHAPEGWRVATGPLRITVPPRQERPVRVPVTAGKPGLGIVTADIAFGPWDLREWTEAMVDAAVA